MGGRLLAECLRRPWKDLGVIRETQDAVRYFLERDELREALREALTQVYDLERLSTRISLNRAWPRDFLALRQSLLVLPRIESIFKDLGEAYPKTLQEILEGWDNFEDYSRLLVQALADDPPPVITEGGLFKRGYDAGLDELLDLTEHGEAKLKSLLVEEQSSGNLEKLKLGYNKVFGYYFELPQSQSARAPYHFIRRQTLVNSERFVTPKLKELEDRLMSASEKRKALEYLLFQKLRETMAQARPRFMEIAARLARLDYFQGLAQAARRFEWTRPDIDNGIEIVVKAGRHPVVEAVQGAANFIPNDLALTGDTRILLITGPNMAGKSTVLRQTALLCVMAQIGSFVPADYASLGLADRVFCRVGASDNLARGRSTFMVEMMETARILRQAGPRSLVVLDEIGRGTSTFDGLALAWAVVEELALRGQGGVRTLFATHYHELTSLEGELKSVRNFNIAVKEYKGDIVFLRRLIPGPSDRSYGVEVAKLAGVPKNVVARAKEILLGLERRSKNGARPLRTSSHTLLPGLRGAPEQDMSMEIPLEARALIQELEGLEVDGLTPLQALNFLHQWKSTWGKKD